MRPLQAPASGNSITYDTEVKGFGVRVTAAGAKAFVLNYRVVGRERRITLPIIGAPLGQSQVATTARYAHLLDDPLRTATELVGAIVKGDVKDR